MVEIIYMWLQTIVFLYFYLLSLEVCLGSANITAIREILEDFQQDQLRY
jgi:hypothetical protein